MKALVLGIALSVASLTVQAESSVPFHASIATEISQAGLCGPVGPNGPSCVVINIGGSGHATRMGRVTIDGPSQINFVTLAQTGISLITAADGSTLSLRFAGQFVPTGPADATFQGAWTVESGTGRFDGATGGGTYDGSAAGATGILNIDGTVSSPGKKP